MTLERTHELLQTPVAFGGSCNRQGVWLILPEVALEHGQEAVHGLIRELERVFGVRPSTLFAGKKP